MNCFTNTELADIQFGLGLANGNGHAASRSYQERFPTRHVLNHEMFPLMTQNLSEHGSFKVSMQDTGCLDIDRLGLVVLSHAPHRSPNLSPLVYFFSCFLKAFVYENPVDSNTY
ncbi:hypothetical protein AVEN_65897-1 [Araneus ventricosus]|uniref:DUF4817 domain-containing protein n=1 Tax=Araneus ventricosus TaxID=182803 RepID=A0A4Y2J1G0_ARAVE|nr:hypothetical protein AVEN_65897-1 [Araneus ventricosus]